MARTRTDEPVVDLREDQESSGETAGADTGTRRRAGGQTKSTPKQVMQEVKEDHVVLTAAGLAFYAFLALVPGLIALISIYGLVGDPQNVQQQVEDVASALPQQTQDFLAQQMESITTSGGGALTVGLVVSVVGALWVVSGAMANLAEALSIAYGEDESRGFLKKRAMGLLLGIGAILFGIVAIAAMTVWPAVVSAIDPPSAVGWLLRLAVWPVLAVMLAVALAVLYRVAPDRDGGKLQWWSKGAAVAVVVWVAASIGFQVYVSNFGSYNETYGSLAAIVIMLIWFWISGIVVLLGAEINHVLERQRR